MKRSSIVTLLAAVVLAGAAEAGVVVLKNGKVIVGNIPADTDTAEKLVVKWPTKSQEDRGWAEYQKAEIRWYDREAEKPTDAYWEKFENELIADEYLADREKWRQRRETEKQLKDLSPTGDPSKESADIAVTPGEKKAEPAKPADPAKPEPAKPADPAAPAAPAQPAQPAQQSSGGGLCALGHTSGSPLALALAVGALLITRRRLSA